MYPYDNSSNNRSGYDNTDDGCGGVSRYDGLPDSHVANCVGFTAPPWLLQTSVSFYYFQLGFVYSSWISRIPDTKAALDLSDGGLGMVLVCAVFGAMMGLPLVTWLVNSMGSAQSVLVGSLANAILFPLAGVTWFGYELMTYLFLVQFILHYYHLLIIYYAMTRYDTGYGHYVSECLELGSVWQ